MKHHNMKTRTYALEMSPKYFRVYIEYSNIMAYVPHPTVKETLKQQDGLDSRAKWIANIQ